MSDFTLALRLLAREWRAGELRLLLVVIALAVASVTAVGFFADRVRISLGQAANSLLAADLVLNTDHAPDPAFETEARRLGLSVARTTTFLSMARAGERVSLAGIKAVTEAYPLRGRLRIAGQAFAPGEETGAIPRPGQAWVDAKLATELALAVGGQVAVGERALDVTAILALESERGGNFMALAPRVMINEADLPATGLVREGSRITWRLMLAGQPAELERYANWARPRLARGEKLESVADARPELRDTLDKAERYLGLSALLAVLLAAVSAKTLLRRYVQRQYDTYALLRCFGARRAQLFRLYLIRFAALGVLAGAAGSLTGYFAQQAMTGLLGDALRLDLAPPGWRPVVAGLLAGPLLILAFSLPALNRLADVPTLRVLRRDLGPPRGGQIASQGLGLALVAGLLLWQAGDLKLGLAVLAGLIGAGLAAAALTRLLLAPLSALAVRLPPGPRLGLLALRRRGGETIVLVMALSLGLLALLLLTLVRDDLVTAWRDKLPSDAPNRFLINIQPEQVDPLRTFLSARGLGRVELHPMVRGRLTGINGRQVMPEDYEEERARRLAEREFNLSALAGLPPDNILSAGQWWTPGQRDGFSVEEGLAKRLGIKLGDTLSFDVGGLPVSGRVNSLRRVDWDSFRVNFFVVAPPGSLDGLPASHITSFYLHPSRSGLLADLIAAYPNVTAIDVDTVMTEMRGLLGRVSQAVQVIFLFSLALGAAVLAAALHARRDERAREIGLWRTLGASSRTARLALASEFALLGLLSGAVASVFASALAWVLAERVFELPHRFDPALWSAGLGGGVLLVLAVGLISTRGLTTAPPLAAIRAGD